MNHNIDYSKHPDPGDVTTDLQQLAFGIVITFPSLALATCILRVYSRVVTKNFGWDDTLILMAMVISIAQTVTSFMYIKTAYIGIHLWDIPPHDPTESLVWNYLVLVLYNPMLAIVKMSGLIFLLRLGGHKTGVRISIHLVGAFNLLMMVGCLFAVVFQCTPVEKNWRPRKGGNCINQGVFTVSSASLNIFTDVLVLAIPVWIFRDLRMNKRARWALTFVFLLGLITTAVGCVRLHLMVRVLTVIPIPDRTYSIGYTTSVMETNLAICTASVPALWPLGRRWFPRFFARIGVGSAADAARHQRHLSGSSSFRRKSRAFVIGDGDGMRDDNNNNNSNNSNNNNSNNSNNNNRDIPLTAPLDRIDEIWSLRKGAPRGIRSYGIAADDSLEGHEGVGPGQHGPDRTRSEGRRSGMRTSVSSLC